MKKMMLGNDFHIYIVSVTLTKDATNVIIRNEEEFELLKEKDRIDLANIFSSLRKEDISSPLLSVMDGLRDGFRPEDYANPNREVLYETAQYLDVVSYNSVVNKFDDNFGELYICRRYCILLKGCIKEEEEDIKCCRILYIIGLTSV